VHPVVVTEIKTLSNIVVVTEIKNSLEYCCGEGNKKLSQTLLW
jgi:hypothetical protein